MKTQKKAEISTVRAISPGGVFIGRVTMEQAHRHIRDGVARGIGGRGKQEFRTLQMLFAHVTVQVPTVPKYTYTDTLGDAYRVPTLKRAIPGGSYAQWHSGLSFADLRRGRLSPERRKKGDDSTVEMRRSQPRTRQIGALAIPIPGRPAKVRLAA